MAPLRTIGIGLALVAAVPVLFLLAAQIGKATGTTNMYVLPASSMEPTLHCADRPGCEGSANDRVLALRRFVDYGRGDIVVFRTPPAAVERCGAGGTFVKRLVGLPGERLEVRLIRGDGYVFIDGKRLDEPYIETERRQVSADHGPITIPRGEYFMMGDNREQSCDSREWGTVPRADLIGKVVLTYWPPGRIGVR